MTLKDILTKETYEKYGDMDVYNDWTDDVAPCWCGTLLTEYGATVYPALELEACVVDNSDDDHYILVFINHLPVDEDERMWDETVALFEDMAGYLPEDDFNKRFVIDCDEEEPAPEEPMDILEGHLADTGATVYLGCGGWVLIEDGNEMSFGTWQEMIEYIKEA